MSRPLRSPRLCDELGPRKIVFAPTFRRHKALNPRAEQDFLTLTNCIKQGVPLPDRFYRPRSGARDPLLEEYGVLHLHLEGQTSDTLIFLMQFSDSVVFLETNAHRRFQRECDELIRQHKLQPIPKPEVVVKKRRNWKPPSR